MNRGLRRDPVFFEPADYSRFLSVLAAVPERFAVRIHAFALMPNHFHLLVESTEGRLSEAMAFLGANFTRWTNRRRGWDGPLFRGRFRSKLVNDDAYWQQLLAYIHLNPVRGGLAPHVDEGCWTSHAAYGGLAPVPRWLSTEQLLGSLGGPAGYLALVDEVVAAGHPPSFDPKRLWSEPAPAEEPLGSTEARSLLEAALGPELRHPTAAGRAARRVAAVWLVRRAGWTQEQVSVVVGVGRTTVSRWLVRAPQDQEFERRLNALDARRADLCGSGHCGV